MPSGELDKPVLAYATLRRQVGLPGAVMLGLGSILGTGVFVGLAQATALAGPWVLLAIVIAGALAYCNAMSSAQLAAAHPVSGGTYEYGYRLLSPTWGFIAGWSFLLAKSASAATAALGVGQLLLAPVLSRLDFRIGDFGIVTLGGAAIISYPLSTHGIENVTGIIGPAIGITLILLFVAAVLAGMRRTQIVNALIVSITLVGLIAFIGYFGAKLPSWRWFGASHKLLDGLSNLPTAIALSFVAFAGYARIATLSEEVHDPRTTIPKAILHSLGWSLLLYLGVATILVWSHLADFEGSPHPNSITDFVISHTRWRPLALCISIAAVTAMLGVLLNLILGLSRVWLAMGRRGDMPAVLARVTERTGTPVPATILTGIVIGLLVLVGDVRLTWSFSAFSVLIYYAITNWACLRHSPEHWRYPRALAWAGLVTCLSLAWFVEMRVWLVGVALIGIGVAWHKVRRRMAPSHRGKADCR